ncbi:hypothetical protein BXZ70DRAFT_1060730 [Cristinia sonorae]|uniref:SWIM-type domain-containing protein n=1 Tax=Cristinia sonorae TaxID=1940300 RepID=A0A8K0XV86_9AGAR|nr:hypothetical protein BXZ70DRAFT_1061250 [Cristinia sonorae]KAH8108111.1 hypothetical protein BXZ70DRAFT_1060730 [Cristinia sonorae]
MYYLHTNMHVFPLSFRSCCERVFSIATAAMADTAPHQIPRSRLVVSTTSASPPVPRTDNPRSRLVFFAAGDGVDGRPSASVSRADPPSRMNIVGEEIQSNSRKRPRLDQAKTQSNNNEVIEAPVAASDKPHAPQEAPDSWQQDTPLAYEYASPGLACAEDSVDEYWHALLAEDSRALFRLDSHVFVLQDWDEDEHMLQLGQYFHVLSFPHPSGQLGVACTCPRWKAKENCRHSSLFHMHSSHLSFLLPVVKSPLPPAILLCSTLFLNKLIFSCEGEVGRYTSGKRVIVSLQTSGRWHCQSCRYSPTCKHRPHAIAFAVALGLAEAGTTGEAISVPPEENEPDVDDLALMEAASRDDGLGHRGCISYLPIPAPRWCSLPNEPSFTAPKRMFTSSHFPLSELSRCSCGKALDNSVSPTAIVIRSATLFDLTVPREITIEVVPCPACRHGRRQIGPDLSEFGLFNWNNRFVFAHDVLNTFTSMFTASETPFTAFCLIMRRTYMEYSFAHKFCSDDTFIRVWFAFVRLQQLDSSMTCPTCGPSPSVVIADGVSLAPHISKLTSHISPPTMVTSHSDRVESISTYKARHLPLIKEVDVRKRISQLLEATKTHPSAPSQAAPNIPDLQPIVLLYPALFAFIQLYLQSFRLQTSPHLKSYRTLLDQINAPDIALQLVPYSAIAILDRMGANRDYQPPDWLQNLIPAIGHILRSHRNTNTLIPLEVRSLAGWMAVRACDVYTRLAQHDPGAIGDIRAVSPAMGWQQTGTCYGLPLIRSRRTYPKLRHDGTVLDRGAESKDGDSGLGGCKKYYSIYSKSSLAGGIMALWCTHSICLGFHTMPIAEGRNDVFSAIYTHFPTAPEIIVYDYACQLAAYSLVREARYFRNTKFLIDELHAHGHTTCGQACFSSNAMQFDERIRGINTSAAECGNGGMGRIRKSVSFMTYEHAVVFTKVFLDVWNRRIIGRIMSL